MIDVSNAQFISPKAPRQIYPINDYTHVLNSNQIFKLNQKLINYNKKKSIEIIIAIIDNINREDISMITTTWGTKWKIGKKRESNGIFILLVKKEKKISIQTGYGIEPYLTDITCKKIINLIRPYLQQEQYYFTINKIINFIFQKLQNYDHHQYQEKKANTINIIFYFCIIILIIYLFFKKYNFYFLLDNIFYPIISNHNNDQYNDDNHFGGGGEFGGGGASGNW